MEKPAPHFGKPSGLPSGSWKQPEIMERISETRKQEKNAYESFLGSA
jgi:hypothetical protein